MTHDEARHQLLLHGSGTWSSTGEPLIHREGFLGSLRPYCGLREQNFHLVMEALLTLGERLHRELTVERELVESVWSMCQYARLWGVWPDGMLQCNRLITAADTARLESWIDLIERTMLNLLRGRPPHFAIYHYADYLAENASATEWWDNIDFFVELMRQAVVDPNTGDALSMILKALGGLGGRAKSVLPSLREALLREYPWWSPYDRCTEEVRGEIRATIAAIEGIAPLREERG